MNYKENAKLIDDAIYLNMNNRLFMNRQDIKARMEPISYAREYCTVRLNMGRRFGYSSYIERNNASTDIVVCNFAIHNKRHNYIRSSRFDCRLRLMGSKLPEQRNSEFIWVDDASHMSFETIKTIYELYTPRQGFIPTFVLLG